MKCSKCKMNYKDDTWGYMAHIGNCYGKNYLEILKTMPNKVSKRYGITVEKKGNVD